MPSEPGMRAFWRYMGFELQSEYKPAGDQPKAIASLVSGLEREDHLQTLLGVTGSGKTYTCAQVIQQTQRPTLVLAHNKTLAAQLCSEFREFFPKNAVEYFVSYYDYYQPEAYMPNTDTYIEKEAMINEEIDRLRHSATQAILSRNDVIVVASVSCIYNIGSPVQYEQTVLRISRGQTFGRGNLLQRLIDMHFERTSGEIARGQFRMRGNVFEMMPVNEEMIYRIEMDMNNTVLTIEVMDPLTRTVRAHDEDVWLFPAKHYVVDEASRKGAIASIRAELAQQLKTFEEQGKILEAERLKRKTNYDLEMIEQVGYCKGIENYSRYFDGRPEGAAPYTLLDYFKTKGKDWLLVIDESHVTIPQVGGMYNGDRARKDTLIEYGFRLPSARDNRPIQFHEFEAAMPQTICVSATPGAYELKKSEQVVEQIIRPTGLIDPEIIVAPVTGLPAGQASRGKEPSQIDDIILRIIDRQKKKERTIVTTLTKKMAEELAQYLEEKHIPAKYLHSDIKTIERIEILSNFRKGVFDVLVGVNLLREGLDLPEVSLVAILDADKEGFLRSETSLIQTIGRAARNVAGQVVLYADTITGSLDRAIKETNRRREIQMAYNTQHGITPTSIKKSIRNLIEEFGILPDSEKQKRAKERGTKSKTGNRILDIELAVDPRPIPEVIREKEKQMKESAKVLEFELAAVLRDEIAALKKLDASTKKLRATA